MVRLAAVLMCLFTLGMPWSPVRAAAPAGGQTDLQVLEAFSQATDQRSTGKLADVKKHRVLFYMGAALLLFILTTAGLGIAMAVYGKRVFVAHMIFGGFSVTLALAHAVAAMVWFFPF